MANQRTKTTLADDSYWDYTYDDLGQVTSGRRYTADGVQITSRQSVYDLDEIGNRVTSSTPGYVPYTVNDDNQYTIMRDVSLTYDVAGNVNTYASWTYSWDNENRLIQVVSTSKLIQFTYDTQGRRIEKKVWNNTTGTGTPATYLKYIYDGWNLIAELNAKNSNAVVRTYSWEPEAQGAPGTLRMISDNNGVYFPAYDPNGNVMGLVKATDGTVCAQYEYLPYGELAMATGTMASSNPIRFSTKYRDNETGLYYYGYRYYSPDMGRWLSRDPIEEQGGLNLYGFVNNDPVNKWDRLGLSLGSDILRIFISRFLTPGFNIFFRSNHYDLYDYENEMSNGLRTSLDSFYEKLLCSQKSKATMSWKILLINENAPRYMHQAFSLATDNFTAFWLAFSYDVNIQGSLEFRCNGVVLEYRNLDVLGKWNDNIDANSFPGIAYLKGESKNVFDNFVLSNNWKNNPRETANAIFEGFWDIVGDDIWDTDFNVTITFVDKNKDSKKIYCR